MRNKVEIALAGKKVKVGCPQGQESALLSAASELDSRIEKAQQSDQVNNVDQAVLMAALNLAHDYLSLQKEQAQERQETQSKIDLLQSTIEQALASHQNKSA